MTSVQAQRFQHLKSRLASEGLRGLSRGERISAVKFGLVPPVRSERERQLRSRYGLTLEDYERLAEAQGHVCASCKQKWKQHFYVDHDHASGVVRGLLCARCNSLVGLLESSSIWAAWEYLHQHFLKGATNG